MQQQQFIPYNRPSIGQEEIDEVVEALRSGWLTAGPRTTQFESEFKAYVGAPHALAVNSCTAGLHLALAALNIGPGDEVITTPLTFCATVNTIIHTGATPILADIDRNGNIDPESIRVRITPKTRAIVPVHFGGWPCEMDAIWDIAAEHGLYVVEDAAHAAGTKYRDRYIGGGGENGRRSDAVCFSFYATKNLTTGEGGMITTHSESLYERMRLLCLHGISKDAWRRYTAAGSWFYEVTECGFKYNLNDILSAVGIHQLRKLEKFTAERAAIASFFNESFAGVEQVTVPHFEGPHRHAWHLYALKLNLDRLTLDRAGFIEELRGRGVGASVHFIPIPLHPYYREMEGLSAELCPATMALYPRTVSLPLYPGMTEAELKTIVSAVKDIAHRHRAAGAMRIPVEANDSLEGLAPGRKMHTAMESARG